ncbi:hypothetical protein K461DRAFT_281324 [Myriangium duriaei CBS 260.36]|uniref:Uncharacterized protein n=1 Tax=Myriangium duriaei CBS 260.36 TaxID=1168546 RepID=A0A9P4J099_9PEZI|nr:hypothetical protein K461DRAFT_281324 [Myriangium duriaei CBS 260.36]
MTSIQENLARVRAGLASHDATHDTSTDAAHARILAEHAAALNEHEAHLETQRRKMSSRDKHNRRERDRSSGLRFRFKSSPHHPRSGEGHRRKRRRRDDERREELREEAEGVERFTAHPLSRPEDGGEWLEDAAPPPPPLPRGTTTDGDRERPDPDSAFAASLFDALADDEGAAGYWEGVYSQPVHVYARPKVRREEGGGDGQGEDRNEGELEDMTDEEYVAYVKRRMWERLHPEEVREVRRREERERERGREKREREEKKYRKDEEEETDPLGVQAALNRGTARRSKREVMRWVGLWRDYQARWAEVDVKRLPWPTESGAAPTVDERGVKEVKAFFAGVKAALPAILGEEGGEIKDEDVNAANKAVLKAERFRWHPDKMMQRFGKALEEGDVMSRITAVFQVIDGLLGELK